MIHSGGQEAMKHGCEKSNHPTQKIHLYDSMQMTPQGVVAF
jgi:hypothetical protein